MRITKGNFAGSRVFGDEAQRLHDLYVSDGYEYVCVDNQLTGMIHMACVSAQFDAEFDSYEDALAALQKDHGGGVMTAIIAALAWVVIGAMAGCLLILLLQIRKDTTDARQTFATVEAAVSYCTEQEIAGYDCWMSPYGDKWEVRCYRRGRQS